MATVSVTKNIHIHPNCGDWHISVSEDDGIAYVGMLANSSVGMLANSSAERFHPTTEQSMQICRMLKNEGLLEKHDTINGIQFSIVSEEAQNEIQNLYTELQNAIE